MGSLLTHLKAPFCTADAGKGIESGASQRGCGQPGGRCQVCGGRRQRPEYVLDHQRFPSS